MLILRSLGRLANGSPRAWNVALGKWNDSSTRTFFSFLKKKKSTGEDLKANSAPKSESTHAELIWAETSRNLEKNKLAKCSENAIGLKHSQLKQLKKATFLDAIELYKARSGTARRGFNEFITAALREMKAYEVADDLEAYKALLTVLPRKGRLKAKTFLHADMGAYKQQQDTITLLLMQLNANMVMPDDEVGNTIVEVFGFRSYVMTQYRRMMYWVPKLRHANPWPVVERLPDDIEGEEAIRLAQLAAARICPDPSTEYAAIVTDAVEANTPNCIVNAQSSIQKALLSTYATTFAYSRQPRVFYLDGPQFVWYRNLQLAYYVLWANLDSRRLKTQFKKCEEIENRLKSITDTSSWEFAIPGSEKDVFIALEPILPIDRQLPPPPMIHTIIPSKTDDKKGSLLEIQPKRSSLMRRSSVTTCECRRALWDGFNLPRQLTHLPESLTRHEQTEGVILAVGLVAPISNALEAQSRAYGGETSKEMPDPNFSHPLSAPSGLIQQWLVKLREINPALDEATVIMRNNDSVRNGAKPFNRKL